MNLKQFAKNKMHRGQNYKPAFEKFMLNREFPLNTTFPNILDVVFFVVGRQSEDLDHICRLKDLSDS